MRIGGLLEDDAVRRRQPLRHRVQRLLRPAIARAQPGHDAHALRLDEDLTFVAVVRTDRVAKVVVGAQEPRAVPAVRNRPPPRICSTAGTIHASSSALQRRAMAIISSAASTNSPAMNTDSATLPSRLVVVWNDSPGCSEKLFRFRQSFQSARPISGRPCGPSRSRV